MALSKIFVINLDSSQQRWKACEEQLANVDYERISAVDGFQLSSEEQNFYDKALNKQQYHKVLTSGEIGCYLSHRKIWQRIVDEQLAFAIVLEDDFSSEADFADMLNNICQIPTPWDCIKLAEQPEKRSAMLSSQVGGTTLVTYDKIPAKTCAQAISLEGAKRLLFMSQKIGRPVDVDIQHWWENGLTIYGLKPYPFMMNRNTDSEIEKMGQRKRSKSRFFFKAIKQLQFYFKNQKETKKLVAARKKKSE